MSCLNLISDIFSSILEKSSLFQEHTNVFGTLSVSSEGLSILGYAYTTQSNPIHEENK